MSPNPVQAVAAGFVNAYIGFRDANGYSKGGSTTAPANGVATGNAMRRLLGVVSSGIPVPAPVVVPIPGDNTVLTTFVFDPDNLPQFDLDMSVEDYNTIAAVYNGLVDNLGELSTVMLMPQGGVLSDCSLILQSQAKTPSNYTSAWEGAMVLSCNLIYLGRQNFQSKQAAVFRFHGVTSMSSMRLPGFTFTAARNVYESAPVEVFSGENPITLHRFTGDNSRTVFTLGHTPITAAKTIVAVNGLLRTATTDYSVTPAGNLLTFVVAPGTGAIIEVLYEYTGQ